MKQFNQTSALDLINNELRAVLGENIIAEPLKAAIHSAVFPAGKRIRPLLTLALAYDLGGDWQALAPAAISLELLHCASLIHDDLPALDNDDFRRGVPTCHKQFGEATAILAGDCLMPLAVRAILNSMLSKQQCVLMASELCQAFVDLCNGQQRDMLPPEKRGALFEIYTLKTGALFRAAFLFAAVSADLDEKAQAKAKELGNTVGVFFQIVDDYLDYCGLEEEKGRPGNSDARNAKSTIFSGLNDESAIERLREQQAILSEQLDQFASQVGQSAKFGTSGEKTLEETRAVIAGITASISQ